MSGFNELLDKLDLALKKHNRIGYESLNDPPSDVEIAEKMDWLECKDENLKAWFSWRRGTEMGPVSGEEREKQMIFMFGSFPISLDAIIRFTQKRSSDPIWDFWFIPITTDSAGQFFLFNNQEGKDYGKIYLYSASLLVTDPEKCYDSLPAMIETTIASYEKGVIYRDDEGFLEDDSVKHAKLVRKFNKTLGYWEK